MVLFPSTIAKMFQTAKTAWLANSATAVANFLSNNLYYGIVYFLMVIAFTYFYSAIVFNPEKVSENLQKQGGFIPGIRPGLETQHYIAKILNRVNLFGGIFLGLIAVLPFIVQYVTKIQTVVLGGTGLLIVISVILDTMRQIKSQMMMRSYEY
jgi:preprotein translocase subunit SecY